MQTRKRAKSVSFGKKKEHEKKVEEEVVTAAPEKTEEHAEKVEAKETHADTPELSATPPKTEEPEEAAVETPSNEFVSDNPLTTTPEASKTAKEHEPAAVSEPPSADEPQLSQTPEPAAQPTTPTEPEGQPASQELSSTLPPSAFTIQTGAGEQPVQEETPEPAASETEPAKKRFGLYFLVVAFLSFVLGLGAMAGASYLGLVNVNFSRLHVGVPGLLGQKPTPTALPPTAVPTQKPVDLTAYTIAILNGSGISGKAAEVKTSLITAGFKVSSTGNADKSTYTKTEISAKKTVNHDFLTKLEDELNKTYDVDTTVASAPDSDTTDVTVTLGSQTAK